MSLSQLGPPLSDDEWEQETLRRYRRPQRTYQTGPMMNRLMSLIEKGATYKQIHERIAFSEINVLRAFCRKHGLRPLTLGSGGRPFPREVHEQVKKLLAANHTYGEIFEMVRPRFTSVGAVRTFAQRHGYKGAKPAWKAHSQEAIGRVWGLIRAGHSIRKIAAIMRMTPGQVAGLIWGYGLRHIRVQPEVFYRVYGDRKENFKGFGRSGERSPTSARPRP